MLPFMPFVQENKKNKKKGVHIPELVFPKAFEFFKFLTYCTKQCTKLLIANPLGGSLGISGAQLYFNCVFRGTYYRFNVVLIDDSDVNFRQLFQNVLAQDDTSQKAPKNLICIGSCGSPDRGNMGKWFDVERAVKGDRGTLDMTNHYRFRRDKEVVRKPQHQLADHGVLRMFGISSTRICTTNFLNNSVIDPYFEGYLCDMETWDFFDVCEALTSSSYISLRFVTDFVQLEQTVSREKLLELITPEPDGKQISISYLLGKIPNQSATDYWNHLTINGISKEDFEAKLPTNWRELSLEDFKKIVRLLLPVDFSLVFSMIAASSMRGLPNQETHYPDAEFEDPDALYETTAVYDSIALHFEKKMESIQSGLKWKNGDGIWVGKPLAFINEKIPIPADHALRLRHQQYALKVPGPNLKNPIPNETNSKLEQLTAAKTAEALFMRDVDGRRRRSFQ